MDKRTQPRAKFARHGETVSTIETFLAEYEREYDYWDAAASRARDLIESELNSSGLRAIVTSRAKSVDRLAEKLAQRNRSKTYRSVAQIRADIVDLAGVRVALYFPGQMDEAERLIRGTLDVTLVKRFPADHVAVAASDGGADPQARNRFSGYGARHFRAQIRQESLNDSDVRYGAALVEVQVASVLMHAWSEVEHDLVYKPLEGQLSRSEYALLDQLNGLVLAGEIALEQLQKAGDERVAATSASFRDHFELGEFLRSRPVLSTQNLTDATLGRVDILFDFLAAQGAATPRDLSQYVALLEQDFESRPVAEQLADLMLSGDSSLYLAYRKAISKTRHPSGRSTAQDFPHMRAPSEADIGAFVMAWAEVEDLLAKLLPDFGRRPFHTQLRAALEQGVLNDEQARMLSDLRMLRNRIVHGLNSGIPAEGIADAASHVRQIAHDLRALA